MKRYRIGQIVPSSNTTMETEIPGLLRMREHVAPEQFSFHSSRMRMKHVTPEELAAMDRDSDRCALELSDAQVDVLGYACLVAIMSMGPGYHRVSENRLHEQTVRNGAAAPVVTSAGALICGIQALGARVVSVVCPYMKPLAKRVVDYLENEGITVRDYLALEVPDNLAVGRLDPNNLLDVSSRVSRDGIDALVLSACVQMPSLPVIEAAESKYDRPVISAAVCTTHQMLKRLGLDTHVPGGGTLLSGRY